MTRVEVKNGRKYRADIVLTGFETWASNNTIVQKLVDAGFRKVTVRRISASNVKATGVWGGKDVKAEMPSQVKVLHDITDPDKEVLVAKL